MISRLKCIPQLIAVCLLVIPLTSVRAQETTGMLLERAFYLEEVNGRLDEALALYRQIIADSTTDRSLMAVAQLQIARCLAKRDDSGADSAYRKVIEDYPEQRRSVLAARQALKNLQVPEIQPLVEWYCRRIPPDPMTSFSLDGRYQILTDWSNGNLVIKDWKDGSLRQLTRLDSTESGPVFAYHGVWSDNAQLIAFSQYQYPGYLELRTISVKDARVKLIYSGREQRVFPQGWSSDNKRVLCEIVQNFKTGTLGNHFLAFIGLDGSFTPLVAVSPNSRGLKLSPDDRYLAYDRLVDNNRHVFTFDINNGTESRITTGITNNVGYESPVWSRDGKLLLYRSQLRGRSDLWAVPVSGGKANGNPSLVQSDLTGILLKIRRVGELHNLDPKPPQLPRRTETATPPFREEFTSDILSKEWMIWSWPHSDVYGNNSFGRYSLSANPGFLRYSLDPMMSESWGRQYIPSWDKWFFCYYPSLEISRLITGRSYRLEARVVFSMVKGSNDRRLTVKLVFHPREKAGDYLLITRNVGATNISQSAVLYKNFTAVTNVSCLSAADTASTRSFAYRFVMTRQDTILTLETAGEREPLLPVLKTTIPYTSPNDEQELVISGNSWFVPAMSHADWDYIRFTPLVPVKDE